MSDLESAAAQPATGGDKATLVPSLAIVLSALLWGTFWIPMRALNRAGLGAMWPTTAGFTLPLVCLLPSAIARRRRIVKGGRLVLAIGFLMALSVSLYAQGILRGEVARVILLFYLTPVWSALLARWMLDYPMTRGRVATITLGLAGMFVVFGASSGLPVPRTAADWMGLLSGIIWALALVYMRRGERIADFDKLFVQFLFLGLTFLLLGLVPGETWTLPYGGISYSAAVWLIGFGLLWVPGVVWLTIFGGSRLDPGRAAILLTFEVVVGLVSAGILTSEPLGTNEIVGAILIVAAGVSELVAGAAKAPAPAR